MIRANQLRIDTTVRVNGHDVKVCSVTRKKIGYHAVRTYGGTKVVDGQEVAYGGAEVDNSRLTFARLSEVEPIPITAEWLESNGYEHTVYEEHRNRCCDLIEAFGPFIEMRAPNHRIVVSTSSNRPSPYDWYVHVDNERFASIGGRDIAYVHELQGMLIDCGMEKEAIELN